LTFHETDLMRCIDESMDYFEVSEKAEGMMSKIIKGALSVMFFIGIISYGLGLDKPKSGGMRKN
jgi:hypothetical protein